MSIDKTMKCADCLHYEACQSWIRHGTALWDDFHYSVEDCPFYEDKSEWIHLPCKVGDTFYAPIRGEVCEFECTGFMCIRKTILLIDEYNRAFSFNQDAFLTREEAEKALAERE